jgi:hypothetical protein
MNINELREAINKTLCTDEGMKFGCRPEINKLLFKIIDKERIKLDRIRKLQFMSMFSGIPKDEEDVKMKEDEVTEKEKAEIEDEFDVPMSEATSVNAKKSPEKLAKTPYFLNKIEIPKVKTNELIGRGEKDELDQEFTRLFSIREQTVKMIKKRSNEYSLKDCAIVCRKCDLIVCHLKHLKMRKETQAITEIRSSMTNLFDIEMSELSES